MSKYNGSSVRNSFQAALCAILFSATCVVGAVGPANADTRAQTHVIVSPNA